MKNDKPVSNDYCTMRWVNANLDDNGSTSFNIAQKELVIIYQFGKNRTVLLGVFKFNWSMDKTQAKNYLNTEIIMLWYDHVKRTYVKRIGYILI